MAHIARKSFLFSADGINTVAIVPGDQRDFGEATEGLLKEGYIGPVEPVKPAAPVAKVESIKATKATASAAKKA